MGRPRTLDDRLMDRIAKKLKKGRRIQVNRMVSREASRRGISSEAALVIIAKGLGIGTSSFQKRLDENKCAEIRESLPGIFGGQNGRRQNKRTGITKSAEKLNKRTQLRYAVEYIIQDQELEKRCTDLILAPSTFDRAINQATQTLEDRIRKKAEAGRKVVGDALISAAFNGDLAKTTLKLSSHSEEQEGLTHIFRGIMLAFRHKTHHHLVDFTREEAMKVCGFVDVLLKVVDGSQKIR